MPHLVNLTKKEVKEKEIGGIEMVEEIIITPDSLSILVNFQNISPKDLIVLINKTMKGRKFGIGEIDLQKNFSFFEVDKGMDDEVIRRFRGSKYKGLKINVELANPKGSKPKRKKKQHRKGQGRKRR